MEVVFVYGSLKQGCWNNHILSSSKFLGKALTKDNYLLTTVGFPYLMPFNRVFEHFRKNTKRVVGELYLVDNVTLKKLDILEGVSSSHYKQEEIEVITSDDKILKAISYIPCNDNVQNYPQVESDEVYEW